MSEASSFPDLPLMLAGIPHAAVELLRSVGLPAIPLPRVPLVAAGTGRFVLFDSRDLRIERQIAQLSRLGLVPIDFRELTDGFNWPDVASACRLAAARQFLDRLKIALEHQGGAWVRVADYPFPWQSAMCLAVEHPPELVADFPFIADSLPRSTTHFVSGRIRGDELQSLTSSSHHKLGWHLTPDDFESTRRKTLSHWQGRIDRFRAAGLNIGGLFISQPGRPLPAADDLQTLGFGYLCQPAGMPTWWEETADSAAEPRLVRFDSAPLPENSGFVEWVGEHYQAGCPLVFHASTTRAGLVSSIHELASEAARCTLLWQPTLDELAHWHRTRRQLRLQVWRRPTGFEIHADGDLNAVAWGLEIWRGSHLATVPLPCPELHVADDGLIFLRAHKRHPAGAAIPNDAILDIVTPKAEWNQSLAA